MAIKKSLLESHWYYRAIKTSLQLAPLFVAFYAYGMGFINIDWLWSKDIISILILNKSLVFEITIALIIYYIVLSIIWKIVLYLLFGGVIDDIALRRQKISLDQSLPTLKVEATNSEEVVEKYIEKQNKRSGEAILWIIFILCIIAIAYYGNSHSSYVPGVPNPSPKCVSTGCGKSWRCVGTYYSDGLQRSINGCYSSKTQTTSLPSWSGTCRQCP